MCTIFVLVSLSFMFVTRPVSTKDILTRIFSNTVATFGDAVELLYNSFHLKRIAQNKKRQEELRKKNEQAWQQRSELTSLNRYLKKNKINISQPISKQDFAMLLFERFTMLPVSFLSKTLQFNSLYFRDAKKLNIFKSTDLPEETLTVKEMVNAFLKANQLRSAH